MSAQSSSPKHCLPRLGAAVGAAVLAVAAAQADTIAVIPAADVTLISSTDGTQYALGAAYNIFCGRVGTNGEGTLRRAALRFDLSSIPAGSTITSVTFKLYMTQSTSGAQVCTMHKATESWGEGASFAFGGGGTSPEPGDATWNYRFWPTTQWSTPGGQFVSTASATKSINGVGFWTFTSTPALVADVQSWVGAPQLNYGWIVRGNEVTLETAKKFEARESTVPERRPLLTVTYTPPPPPTPGDLNGDAVVNGADLGILLGAWGTAAPGDLNSDGTVNGADLGLLLGYWTV
ncbi:MAG: DNRLRE domain-containing protein [Phycisphaerae bacterium]|nr:DNRLRE domain-containing protein [Phycisphaerae bacterium]